MTTMVKVTGLTVADARQCLMAALGYLNSIEEQNNISLTVTPNYYFSQISDDPNSENINLEKFSVSLKKNGKVE